jgi:hypothetical protein
MAQVCGDSSFDYLWDRQHDVALGVLRKAADSWAIGGPSALNSDAVIAVMFRIYLSEWPEYRGIRSETRDLHVWLQVVPPALDEITARRPSADPLALATVLRAIEAECSCAITQWTLGDPESPPTAHALNAIEHILFTHKLTRRPGSPKMPTSLIEQESTRSTG